MSSGFMSCVRENSPSLKFETNGDSRLLSMTEINSNNGNTYQSLEVPGEEQQSDVTSSTNSELQKRRRFNPLRNLRRIFRRRTITNDKDTANNNPCLHSTSSNSEQNLRSVTLSAIPATVSASTRPTTLAQEDLQESYASHSLPKSTSNISNKAKDKRHIHRNSYLEYHTSEAKIHKEKSWKKWGISSGSTQVPKSNTSVDADMYTTSSTTYYQVSVPTLNDITGCECNSGEEQTLRSIMKSQFVPRKSGSVAAFPISMNNLHFSGNRKFRSIGNSSQDLDSGGTGNHCELTKSSISKTSKEISECKRRLNQDAVPDRDLTQDALSQSQDSVFSEPATAKSLSIGLKTELADVLRKRRSHAYASDEDLGLPRSPISPQRHMGSNNQTLFDNKKFIKTNSCNSDEALSLSLTNIKSNDLLDCTLNSTTNVNHATESTLQKSTESLTLSFKKYSKPTNMLTPSDESIGTKSNSCSCETDLFSSNVPKLSHEAAKHKMAIRPQNRKGPSRLHRNTINIGNVSAIQKSTESIFKSKSESRDTGFKTKIHTESLIALKQENSERQMSGSIVNSTIKQTKIEKENLEITKELVVRKEENKMAIKQSIVELEEIIEPEENPSPITPISASNYFGLRGFSHANVPLFNNTIKSDDAKTTVGNSNSSSEKLENIIQERLIQRNSKRTISKVNSDEKYDSDIRQSEPKKLQIMTTFDTSTVLSMNNDKSKSIQKLNSPILEQTADRVMHSNPMREPSNVALKTKWGPAARQRYAPQKIMTNDTNESLAEITQEQFDSTTIVRKLITPDQALEATPKMEHHFEKKPKVLIGNVVQQRISRCHDLSPRNLTNNNCGNPLEMKTVTKVMESDKQIKFVEKSQSFRTYDEQDDLVCSMPMHNNLRSLPDLTLHSPVPDSISLNNNKWTKVKTPKENCVTFDYKTNVAVNTINNENHKETSTALTSPKAINYNKVNTEMEENKYALINILRKSLATNSTDSNKIPSISFSPTKSNEFLFETSTSTSVQNRRSRPTNLQLKLNKKPDEITTTMVPLLEKPKSLNSISASIKESEQKTNVGSVSNSENLPSEELPKRSSISVDNSNNHIPEFMKIQLTPVKSPSYITTTNVVLSKNPKTSSSTSTPNKEDRNSRRYSNESVEIFENNAIIVENNAIIENNKKDTLDASSKQDLSVTIPIMSNEQNINKMSLQERKRMFMQEENLKIEQKIDQVRIERKKSMTDESIKKSPVTLEPKSTLNSPEPITDNNSVPLVIIRKTSIRSTSQQRISNSMTNTETCKDDTTPELIKVFARRSLKIKDDDLHKIVAVQSSESTLSTPTPTTIRANSNISNVKQNKHVPLSTEHLDSDKENQSSNDKLLNNNLENILSHSSTTSTKEKSICLSNGNAKTNKTTINEYRFNNNAPAVIYIPSKTISNLYLKNHTDSSTTPTNTTGISTNNNNNNNNNNNIDANANNNDIKNNCNTKTIETDREALSSKVLVVDNETNITAKIERPSTLNEFKCIHQRRAEWEKRAKEALK